MTVTYHVGDTRAVTASIPTGSVSLVACSPPFIALRSYLPDDHPDKALEIGSEPDPATFLDTLLALTEEWGRVLAPWGSIAIELGDTYAGSGGHGGDYADDGLRSGQPKFAGSARAAQPARSRDKAQPGTGRVVPVPTCSPSGAGWPRAKSLALIPQLYATSLAYGRNLLRSGVTAVELLALVDNLIVDGMTADVALEHARRWLVTTTAAAPEFEPWLVRNVVVWHRPNPAVGALGDKVRPSTSYITIATRSPKRWFDLDAVRTPFTGHDCWFDEHDTWTITTQPSRLAHFAMWPAKLAERLVLSMSPAEACAKCGEPRRRITRSLNAVGSGHVRNRAPGSERTHTSTSVPDVRESETLGWSDCGHGAYRPGVVLDPFAGTGTTLAVADLHGRDAIGIDIDDRNAALYPARRGEVEKALFGVKPQIDGQLGMFGEVAG